MSGHAPSKFPYLILQNITGDKSDKICQPKSRNKECSQSPRISARETNQKSQIKTESPNQGQGMTLSQDYATTLREPPLSRPQITDFLSNSRNHFSAEFNQALSSISITQMKAILTAQKELRKPAGSLYPSAAQFSLIPETELIYKKYFPTEEPCNAKTSTNNPKAKYSDKESSTGEMSDDTSASIKLPPKDKDIAGKLISAPPANMKIRKPVPSEKEKIRTLKTQDGRDVPDHISVKPGTPLNSKDLVIADSRFKRKVHQQLLSITSEMERQSTELADLRKEVKELRMVTRKSATENDSSKARLDTLSKHMIQLDSKLDTVQDSIGSQEKSILSKLMLIGEMSDSDSDLDDAGTLKGLDALSSPSSTTTTTTTRLTPAKRTSSAPTCSSPDLPLPRACCNWIPIAPDFDKLVQSVALLNYRMDRNQSMKLCTTNNGATFKHSDVVDLTLFKNGMILGSTGFRSYSTMSVIRFVNEIFNGYLPTELSTQYPDGVVIVLTDKRSVVHSCEAGFQTSGSKIMAKNDPPDLLPGKASCDSFRRRSQVGSARSSTVASRTSLSSVPSTTRISNYEMLSDLQIKKDENALIHHKEKVITLKIIDRKNGHKYKLNVPVKATVKALTDHLAPVLSRNSSEKEVGIVTPKNFSIVLPLPLGKLSCLESTLEDYGITQNTLLYLQENLS